MADSTRLRSKPKEEDEVEHHHENGKIKAGDAFDPFAVRWMERFEKPMDSLWGKVPGFLKPILVSLSVFTLGTTIKGEWIIVLFHMMKQMGYENNSTSNISTVDPQPFSWEYFNLQGFPEILFYATIVGYAVYFAVGGFIHWYFYVRQRDRPHDWKCQPTQFMPPELERHEIIFGSLSLFCNTLVSALMATSIKNGGYTTIYYDFGQFGYFWLFAQLPVIFLYQDYCAYWMHRIFHLPSLYKHFHKMHHKYKQPTAFSVTALHPVESITMQMVMVAPIFVIPLHWFPFYVQVFYIYYHGILDHSGVNFKAHWWQPWQPDAIFHDNHHQYFHVNFGFNVAYWDKLHGTHRRSDRIYTEEIFYGGGKNVTDASKEELDNDISERLAENPKAYRTEKLEYLEAYNKNELKI